MNTKPSLLFSGPITVHYAGIVNGTTIATLRDAAGLVADVYVYGNEQSDIERVKARARQLAKGPELIELAREAARFLGEMGGSTFPELCHGNRLGERLEQALKEIEQ